jgi:hypothetical protein
MLYFVHSGTRKILSNSAQAFSRVCKIGGLLKHGRLENVISDVYVLLKKLDMRRFRKWPRRTQKISSMASILSRRNSMLPSA